MNDELKNRIGRFAVSGKLLRLQPDAVVAIQRGMAIVRAEEQVWRDVIEFIAVGPMFRPVNEAEIVPMYTAIVSRDDDGSVYVDQWAEIGPDDYYSYARRIDLRELESEES